MSSSQSYSLEVSNFTDENPMGWALLSEMPYMDRDASGSWVCGANKAWGVLKSNNPSSSHYCTSCPPCKADRFQTRLMARDAGPPCCTTESYDYGTGAWPYEFAGGSTCPQGPDLPLYQDLYYIKKRPMHDLPLALSYNPYLL